MCPVNSAATVETEINLKKFGIRLTKIIEKYALKMGSIKNVYLEKTTPDENFINRIKLTIIVIRIIELDLLKNFDAKGMDITLRKKNKGFGFYNPLH